MQTQENVYELQSPVFKLQEIYNKFWDLNMENENVVF
jgi:hypothetical protein